MSPYRTTPREEPGADAATDYAPRLLWEGPLHPDTESTQRIRVVRVFEQKGRSVVAINKIEVLLAHASLGEPCWIDVPSSYQAIASAALAAAFGAPR